MSVRSRMAIRGVAAVLSATALTVVGACPIAAEAGEEQPVIVNAGRIELVAIGGTLVIGGEKVLSFGPDPECSDGLDNDGDGRVDYPDDRQCTSADDDTERSPWSRAKEHVVIAGAVWADGRVYVPSIVLSAPPTGSVGGIYFPVKETMMSATGAQYSRMRVLPAPVVGTDSFLGTIDPVTGELDLTIGLRIVVDFYPAPLLIGPYPCTVGADAHRIVVGLTTGTTTPPEPHQPLSGAPYRWNTGRVGLVGNTFALPALGAPNPPEGTHPHCIAGPDSAGLSQAMNDFLGLPSAAGESSLSLDLVSSPIVNEQPNAAPTADAGLDQDAAPGDVVTLSGSGFDADGDPLTYRWARESGPEVTLNGATTATPTFTPTEEGTYVFELTVTDHVATATDTVTVTVARPEAISGTVTSSAGGPLSGARLRLFHAGTATQVAGFSPVFTAADGTYSFGNELPVGSYTVQVQAAGHQMEWFDDQPGFSSATPVAVTASGAQTVDVELQAQATLGAVSGSITSGGDPVSPVAVQLWQGGSVVASTVTLDGAYSFGHVAPGSSYRVRAGGSGYPVAWHGGGSTFSDPNTATFSVTAGTTTSGIDLSLASTPPGATLGTIGGTVTQGGSPVSGGLVHLYRVEPGNATTLVVPPANVGIDGSFSFGDLPAGQYRVRRQGSGNPWYVAGGPGVSSWRDATVITLPTGGTSSITFDLP